MDFKVQRQPNWDWEMVFIYVSDWLLWFYVQGILSSVILDGTILHQWKMFPVSFHNLSKLVKAKPVVQVEDFVGAKTSFKTSMNSTFPMHLLTFSFLFINCFFQIWKIWCRVCVKYNETSGWVVFYFLAYDLSLWPWKP